MAGLPGLRNAIGSSSIVLSRLLTSAVFKTTQKCFPRFHSPSLAVRTVGFLKPSFKHSRTPSHQETVRDNSEEENLIREEVIAKVNSQISNKCHGRLFAVVHLANKQWKITPEDIVVVEGYWPPTNGDIIRLEKVLLVGSSDFTIVGAPILQPDLVDIRATVIEKRLSHTRTSFYYRPRKHRKTTNFYRRPQTMLRINTIEFGALINETRDIEGLENRIF